MAAPHRSLLDIEKLCPVVGTCEPNAFLLSLREDDDLSSVHSYGIHCVPHIGKEDKDRKIYAKNGWKKYIDRCNE